MAPTRTILVKCRLRILLQRSPTNQQTNKAQYMYRVNRTDTVNKIEGSFLRRSYECAYSTITECVS